MAAIIAILLQCLPEVDAFDHASITREAEEMVPPSVTAICRTESETPSGYGNWWVSDLGQEPGRAKLLCKKILRNMQH
jgi:hypothetical protein